MSERYFVKAGDYRPSGHVTWYVKERVPGHDPYIVAACNHRDDAELVRAALEHYDAEVRAGLVAGKTVSGQMANQPDSTPETSPGDTLNRPGYPSNRFSNRL